MPATSARIRLVDRQGAQKAEENWIRVARWPSDSPRSALVRRRPARSAAVGSGSPWPPEPLSLLSPTPTLRIRPLRWRQTAPPAIAQASATISATTPAVMAVLAYGPTAEIPGYGAGMSTSTLPVPAAVIWNSCTELGETGAHVGYQG